MVEGPNECFEAMKKMLDVGCFSAVRPPTVQIVIERSGTDFSLEFSFGGVERGKERPADRSNPLRDELPRQSSTESD